MPGGEQRREFLQRDGNRLARSRRADGRYHVIALGTRRDRDARETVLGERIADDVRRAPDASERARRRVEIDDEAIRMEEIAGTRRRHVELDRSLVREIREVFGLAQDGIDGDVPILACLARVLL